jgi:hypothetical protein
LRSPTRRTDAASFKLVTQTTGRVGLNSKEESPVHLGPQLGDWSLGANLDPGRQWSGPQLSHMIWDNLTRDGRCTNLDRIVSDEENLPLTTDSSVTTWTGDLLTVYPSARRTFWSTSVPTARNLSVFCRGRVPSWQRSRAAWRFS